MKKHLFFAALCSLFLVSCNSNEPSQTKQVTFRVEAFSIDQQPMNGPRRAPILDDEDGTPLTDLYIFDGTTLLVHQTSDNEAFGEVTLSLSYGSHDLSFVATRSTEQSYSEGVLSVASLRPTFGKLQSVTISDATDAFNITMNRVTGQLFITIEDAIPNDADHMAIVIASRCSALNVTTLGGVNAAAYNQPISLTSAQGQTGKRWNFNMLTPTYGEQYTTDVTITVYRSDNSVVAQHVIEDVPICSNTKTLLSGKMFSGSSFTISANHEWEEPINGGW